MMQINTMENKMPLGGRIGSNRQGLMTGRVLGFCSGLGFGRVMGSGRGQGGGRGRW